MSSDAPQIRTCLSCGLRYPLIDVNTFGTRCPVCLGETRLTLRLGKKSDSEPKLSSSSDSARALRTRFAVLLDNIRSAWNVGSIFRSADGFGFTHAYLCGITPTPESEAVTKTSLGAEDMVTWSYHKDAVQLVRGLKKESWHVWALEEHEFAVSLSAFPHDESPILTLLIIGNEVTGVDSDLLELSDSIIHIPMRGEKTSFNVAVAFGIAAYQLTESSI